MSVSKGYIRATREWTDVNDTDGCFYTCHVFKGNKATRLNAAARVIAAAGIVKGAGQ